MKLPNWYWSKGLHDARVINVSCEYFNFDYTLKKPIRNCIEIELDSQNAMFDTSIKSIKLYNSKIIQGDTDFIGWFWKDDKLIESPKENQLEINLISYPHMKTIKILFEKVDIRRADS